MQTYQPPRRFGASKKSTNLERQAHKNTLKKTKQDNDKVTADNVKSSCCFPEFTAESTFEFSSELKFYTLLTILYAGGCYTKSISLPVPVSRTTRHYQHDTL